MNEISKFLASWAPTVFFIVLFIVPAMATFGREADKNVKFDTPEEHQVFWHVVHNRRLLHGRIGFMIAISLLWLIANKLHVFD
jgi:hypothetical protein